MIGFVGLGLVLVLSFTGCETPPAAPVQVQRSSAVLNGSKDRVWPQLVSQVGLDYPVKAIEKESGLITTDWVNMPAGFNNMYAGRWVVPPGGLLATWNGLRMNMKIMAVETEPGRTQITINCHYEAFEDNVSKSWIVARSNGSIENAILSKIETQLASAPPVPDAPVATPTAKIPSASDTLIELKKLFDAGVITADEYAAKKKALLEKL